MLAHLRGGVACLVLFGTQSEPIPDWALHVSDWATLGRALATRGV